MARTRPRKRPRRDSTDASQTPSSTQLETPTAEAATQPAKASEPADNNEAKRKFNIRWDVGTGTKSNEEILAAQMDTWTSAVYDHFVMPPAIIESRGEIKYQFTCKKHPNRRLTRIRHDDSTSNLIKHYNECTDNKKKATGTRSIEHFAHGSTYSKAEFRYLITLWVTTCHRPFSILEDEPLQEMLHMLYDPVDIPSPTTISRDVKEVFQITKRSVLTYLAKLPGAIHIQFDGWTSPNIISFLGVVVSFEDNGIIKSFTLDFIKLRKSHTGENLARELHKCLTSYGITKKILAQVADNASNNDTMAATLDPLLDGPGGEHTRVRCFCHILNLCVKAILRQFNREKMKQQSSGLEDIESDINEDTAYQDLNDDEDLADNEGGSNAEELNDDEEYEADEDQHAFDENSIDELEDNVRTKVTKADLKVGCFALTKIKGLAKRIFHSPTISADLKELCDSVHITPQRMVRAVDTRWNTVALMLQRALMLRPALDILVTMTRHNGRGSSHLKRFKLDKEEWQLLQQLRPILEVIPYFDRLDRMLQREINDTALMPAVRAAAERGRAVLNKYYAKTDDSIMYRCALILHPRYKLAYFRNEGWPQDWIDAAVDCVRDTWVKHYKPNSYDDLVITSQPASTSHLDFDFFADIDDFGKSSQDDALEEYLNSPTINSVTDPIKWWWKEEGPLARMALDFLSTPASSTDVERAFSHGGLTISKQRHSLSDESTRAAAVLNSWASIPGLIPKPEIVKVFKEKASRHQPRVTSQTPETVEISDTE